jgi:acetyl-CoA carboxylase carboxyl transferase subunit alpha
LAKRTFLDFEQPIAELETKIEELRYVQTESAVDISEEIDQLGKKSQQLTKDIYSQLSPWQITKIAAPSGAAVHDGLHQRDLHGFRRAARRPPLRDDQSIVGGLARFNGKPCMVLGHQKGRDTKERALRNFGMSRPEGYRKALRLMKTAEKFKLPVFTFVDTPGAYPGIDAEERGQSEAIGRNIYEMAQLEVPIITTIIGEGGSGGALAISVGDQVLMLQYSIYSVISPEGCASILWKTSDKAQEAADAMGITGASPEGAGPDRQDRQRAGGRRPSRPQADGRVPQARAERRLAPGERPEGARAAGPALRAAAKLWPLHRHQGRSRLILRAIPAARAAGAPGASRAARRRLQRRRRFHRAAARRRRTLARAGACDPRAPRLQEAADAFEQHCRQSARRWRAAAGAARATRATPAAKARRTRRAGALPALARRRATRAEAVLLAQHADDQVETLLLALSRGAGLPGWRRCRACSSARHACSCGRCCAAGARRSATGSRRRHAVVEDPSNADTAFTRNRIRHRCCRRWRSLPAVPRDLRAFGAPRRAGAGAAGSWRRTGPGATQGAARPILRCKLPRERQANWLRHWLRTAMAEAERGAARRSGPGGGLQHARAPPASSRVRAGRAEGAVLPA